MRGYNAEVLGRVAARIARVPTTIVWVHNHGDTEPRGHVRILVDRALDRMTTAYFGVAQAQLSYLIDELGYPPEKISIVYNGVDPTLFDPTNDRRCAREFGSPTPSRWSGYSPRCVRRRITVCSSRRRRWYSASYRRRSSSSSETGAAAGARTTGARTRHRRPRRVHRVTLRRTRAAACTRRVRAELLQRRVLPDGTTRGDGCRSAGGLHRCRWGAGDDHRW